MAKKEKSDQSQTQFQKDLDDIYGTKEARERLAEETDKKKEKK